MAKIPTVSHLHVTILSLLNGPGKLTGSELRQTLADRGELRKGAAFTQLMNRMRNDGLIESEYISIKTGGQPLTGKAYTITDKGRQELREVIGFYNEVNISTDRPELSDPLQSIIGKQIVWVDGTAVNQIEIRLSDGTLLRLEAEQILPSIGLIGITTSINPQG